MKNNPYWKEISDLENMGSIDTLIEAWHRRRKLVNHYAWSITKPESVQFVAKHLGKRAVEIGAGSGYWASLLKSEGVNVTAFDLRPWNPMYYPVRKGGPSSLLYLPRELSLFLSWPPYAQPMATQCLKNFKGDRVVYIGEGKGGCTGDNEFHAILTKNYNLLDVIQNASYETINDRIFVYSRKKTV